MMIVLKPKGPFSHKVGGDRGCKDNNHVENCAMEETVEGMAEVQRGASSP